MLQTTIATQVALNELNNPKEKSPKKEENRPEDKKNNKTLHEKLFGDIHELETKRFKKRTTTALRDVQFFEWFSNGVCRKRNKKL
jgi:hypothetical protein